MSGATPGLAVNESVELAPFLLLQDGRSYSIEVTVIAGGVDSVAGRVVKVFRREGGAATCRGALARKDAGLTTIVVVGVQNTSNDVAAAPWTLSFVVAAGPDRISMVFATGVGVQAECRINAFATIREVVYP
jgi:hypothetical protein